MEYNIYSYAHFFITTSIAILLLLCPLKYYKYIVWILLATSLHWVIFNGCIFDKLHHKDCNSSIIPTNNVTPVLKVINEKFSKNIEDNYLKDTMRPTYIIFFIYISVLTFIIYRLIYKIEFFNTETNENI